MENPLISSSVAMGDKVDDRHFKTSNIYDINSNNIVMISGVRNEGAFNKIIELNVFPCLYNESENVIEIYNKIDFEIIYELSNLPESNDVCFPKHIDIIEENISKAKQRVLNPEDVERNLPNYIIQRRKEKGLDEIERYDYIIVTTEDLADSFKALETMRRLRGYKSKIFKIEEILKDPIFSKGDVVSNLNDNAGKLRAFLRYSYENFATKYVLLGGNHPDIPTRFFYKTGNDEEIVPGSDMYFAELNNDWGKAVYDNYISLDDIVDFDCELSVGRLGVRTPQEVENYVHKLMCYEFYPGYKDSAYLENAFVNIIYDFKDVYTQNSMYTGYLKQDAPIFNCFNCDVIKQLSSDSQYPSGSEVVKRLNKKHYGYIDLIGHGGPEGVCVSGSRGAYRMVTSLDEVVIRGAEEEYNGLDNIENEYYPNWSHSVSCSTLPSYDITDTKKNLARSFVDSYLVMGNYGGVALFGNTADSWLLSADAIANSFFEELSECKGAIKYAYSGELINKARNKSVAASKYCKLIYNLAGDPLINLWTGVPEKMNTNYSLSYPRPILPEWVSLSIVDLNDDSLIHLKTINGEDAEIVMREDDKIRMFYAPNLIPYIQPLNIRYNNFKVSHAFLAGDLVIGGMEGNDANVVFERDSEVTIYALGDILITNGVNFLPGSKLRIYGNRYEVTLSDVTIPTGVTIKITGASLNMDQTVIIEDGAKFIFE